MTRAPHKQLAPALLQAGACVLVLLLAQPVLAQTAGQPTGGPAIALSGILGAKGAARHRRQRPQGAGARRELPRRESRDGPGRQRHHRGRRPASDAACRRGPGQCRAAHRRAEWRAHRAVGRLGWAFHEPGPHQLPAGAVPGGYGRHRHRHQRGRRRAHRPGIQEGRARQCRHGQWRRPGAGASGWPRSASTTSRCARSRRW